ncbi:MULTISPECIES: type II toxin-antitoxin system RelE family toxin [Gordonibacter]|uniref:Type II toxin-antitoxin system RelE/ParE family toxin n=1 Tax=Gordonibacter faecis TaxID=3047475 RepID=A0ABT7DJZ1_9ACTN|nr:MULTISPECIES: type II toxin-antitoxin system RelE/ParE family toxin [unclassified Gordonibacter]MDJ1649838.1 type II toxin-antitoxin system RelE/ParE family toxin [Gordonibacter sp. KGMB12511]HIW75502.1 type II toxin-antitoxin system RelE/ParE family toxin [Candidatus Gordonibacter avicola]
MGYRVELTKRAQKQLTSLDRKTLLLVASFIDKELNGCDDPRTLPSAKKLQGVEDGWRWRVGTYRILGKVDDGRVIVEVFKVGHRREVYRSL